MAGTNPWTRRDFLKGLGAGAAALSLPCFLRRAARAEGKAPLNVVLVLIDDMGWTDVGCFGSRYYQTPRIDELAAQGMKFTDAYSACTVCSPTRAAIMTGKYPAKLHITDWIPGHRRPNAPLKIPDWTMHLPLEEVTVAEALKPAGYATACIGKWHLGGEAFYPDKQGFDLNVGGCHRGQPPSYFSPYRIETMRDGGEGEYLTDRLGDEAIRFIQASKDKPFFLYLPHYAVHTPLQAKKEMRAKYQDRPGQDGQENPVYAAMIESVDESVGRIGSELKKLGLEERTLVIFTSDNGGLKSSTNNIGLRAGKGSAYEGGVRVPLIVKWPGVTKPGGVCHEPVISPDLYPTVLEACGVADDAAQKAKVDGVSLVPLLKGAERLKREAIFWHYPHYHGGGATPYGAVRARDYRLVEFYEDMRVEMYNLKDDLAERKDLAATQKEKAAELREMLHRWREAVSAQMPTPSAEAKAKRERP